MFGQGLFQPLGPQGPATGQAAPCVVHAVRNGFVVAANDQIQIPFFHQFIPKPQQFRHVIGCVDIDQGKGHVADEGLAHQMQHDVAVFANGPQHGQIFEMAKGFADNKDALGLQLVQVIHKKRAFHRKQGES
jgi:hypothetical protein